MKKFIGLIFILCTGFLLAHADAVGTTSRLEFTVVKVNTSTADANTAGLTADQFPPGTQQQKCLAAIRSGNSIPVIVAYQTKDVDKKLAAQSLKDGKNRKFATAKKGGLARAPIAFNAPGCSCGACSAYS